MHENLQAFPQDAPATQTFSVFRDDHVVPLATVVCRDHCRGAGGRNVGGLQSLDELRERAGDMTVTDCPANRPRSSRRSSWIPRMDARSILRAIVEDDDPQTPII
jgi:hypothetical protein